MNKISSEKIFSTSQHCIKLLNGVLVEIKHELPESEFNKVRNSIAEVMGSLVEVCEDHVYEKYPELRPYQKE